MATTTNYGWTTPDDTALVKDGASAIRSLGSAIDSTVYSKLGLVHINTTSFSAVSSQSINDVFSSTYTNYKIIISLSAFSGTDTYLQMRLRVSGADNSSAVYNTFGDSINNAGTRSIVADVNGTLWYLQTLDGATSGYYYSSSYDIYNPQLAFATTVSGLNAGYTQSSAPNSSYLGLLHNSATSFTGFTVYPGNGTISGTIRVYGYKN